MGGFSIWHIGLFAVVVLLLSGGNRLSSMMSDLAKGLKGFKQGMAEEDHSPRGIQARKGPHDVPYRVYGELPQDCDKRSAGEGFDPASLRPRSGASERAVVDVRD